MLFCILSLELLNVNTTACVTVYWRSSSFLKMHTGSVLYHSSDCQTECSHYWVMGHLLPVQSDDCQLSWWVLQFHAHPFTIDMNLHLLRRLNKWKIWHGATLWVLHLLVLSVLHKYSHQQNSVLGAWFNVGEKTNTGYHITIILKMEIIPS